MDTVESGLHGMSDGLTTTLTPHKHLALLCDSSGHVVIVGGSNLNKPTDTRAFILSMDAKDFTGFPKLHILFLYLLWSKEGPAFQ